VSCLANATCVVERVLPIWVVISVGRVYDMDIQARKGTSDESVEANAFGLGYCVVCTDWSNGE